MQTQLYKKSQGFITQYITLLIPIFIFLLFQIALILTVNVLEYDEAIFMNIARNIRRTGLPFRPIGSEEGFLYFTHTPLYLYLLTAMTYLFGENIILLRLTTVGFSFGTLILVYLIVNKLADKSSAFVATLLLALNPFWALYSFFIYMEVPMCFFAVLSFYFLQKKEQTGYTYFFVASGIAVAISVMLKEFAILYWFALALYIVLFSLPWREKILGLFSVTLPLILSFVGWVIWGLSIHAAGFQAAMMRWFGSAVGGQNVTGDRGGIPFGTWGLTVSNEVLSWGMLIIFVIAIILALLFRFKPPKLLFLPLFYIGFALGLSFLVELKEPRHIIMVIPMMAIAIGLMAPWNQLFYAIRQRSFRMGISLFFMGMLVWQIAPVQIPASVDGWRTMESWWQPRIARRMFFEDRYYGILKEAGEYFVDRIPAGEMITIVHEGPVFSYYAQHPYQLLYTHPYNGVVDIIAEADYLLFDYPTFPHLSQEEIDLVMQHIDEHFDEVEVLADDHRQVTIYRQKRD